MSLSYGDDSASTRGNYLSDPKWDRIAASMHKRPHVHARSLDSEGCS